MQNISTIYRFNTPFLDIISEKNSLISIKNKIKKFMENFEWISLIEEKEDLWEYIKFNLKTKNGLIKIKLFYLKEFIWNYYMPIFKMDIFVDRAKFNNKILVWFLLNVFECFDWLDEKDYLIDLDKTIYYKKWIFLKFFPEHSFSDLNEIKTEFEENKWNEILESFIIKFSWNNYLLSRRNSQEFYKIYSIILYYIYLVYILYQNIYDSKKQLDYLETVELGVDWNSHKLLIEKRLKYVNDLSITNFKNYYEKLEVFFNMFK